MGSLDSGSQENCHQPQHRSSLTRSLSIRENTTALQAPWTRFCSAFSKFFSLLWSEASSLTLCKHGFVRSKMYFKNVTNYPVACNHSFRAVIGLSCKYLIRGLGKWGGWEDPVSQGLLATSPSPGPGGDTGVPCVNGQQRRDVLRLHQRLRHCGPLDGAEASVHPHAGNFRATKLNGNQLPQPLLYPLCPENVLISTQMTHRCVSGSPLSFSPQIARLARVLPLL